MHNRFDFPKGIIRVTAGEGGEALLILGDEKVALLDCGMAYTGKKLVANIEYELMKNNRQSVDLIFVSHSHYDHVGALAYVLARWPEALVHGAEKAKHVFESENAVKFMRKMSENARDIYSDSQEDIYIEGMRVDTVVHDGDEIDLGGKCLKILETKGHTDCSLTYVLEPGNIMFASESTGVFAGPDMNYTAMLKSYMQSKESAEKCQAMAPAVIISPHYGVVPEEYRDSYFDVFMKYANQAKDLICKLVQEGKDDKEVLDEFESVFWPMCEGQQLKMAFMANSEACIKAIREEFFPS